MTIRGQIISIEELHNINWFNKQVFKLYVMLVSANLS